MARATSLMLGIAVGALGVLLYQRLRQVVEEENPEVLVERIGRQLEALENRTRQSSGQLSS